MRKYKYDNLEGKDIEVKKVSLNRQDGQVEDYTKAGVPLLSNRTIVGLATLFTSSCLVAPTIGENCGRNSEDGMKVKIGSTMMGCIEVPEQLPPLEDMGNDQDFYDMPDSGNPEDATPDADTPDAEMDAAPDQDMFTCTVNASLEQLLADTQAALDDFFNDFSYLSNANPGNVRALEFPSQVSVDPNCNGTAFFNVIATDQNGDLVSAIDQDAKILFYSNHATCADVRSDACTDLAGGNLIAKCEVTESRFASKDGTAISDITKAVYTTSPDGNSMNITFSYFPSCDYSNGNQCPPLFENPSQEFSLNVDLTSAQLIDTDPNSCPINSIGIQDYLIDTNVIPKY